MQHELHAFRSFISLEFDGISIYQYALHTNNCSCKRAFSSPISTLQVLMPPLWLSSITLRYDIFGRNPLVEGSARPTDLYLTITKKHIPKTHIYAQAGFKHTNPGNPRLRPGGPWGWPEPLAVYFTHLLNSKKSFDRAYTLLSFCVLQCAIVSRKWLKTKVENNVI